MPSPLLILVLCAVVTGLLGSLFIIIPLAVDSWQFVSFDLNKLTPYSVVNSSSEYFVTLATSDDDFSTLIHYEQVVGSDGSVTQENTSYYLFSTYTGVWRMCDKLSDLSRGRLAVAKGVLSVSKCYVFVTEYDDEATSSDTYWKKSIGRMQNSAASCFIVSLIDLVAAAITGVFAIFRRQVSACMVTGVLYCMTGLFAIFGLTIFHTKMYYERYQCYSFDDDKLPSIACDARQVSIGWAIPLSWVGVVICVIAFGLWIFVTRAFRVIKSKTMI